MSIDDKGMDKTGKAASKDARIKTGSQLIPRTTFQPIAAPEKLYGTQVGSVEELLGHGKMKVHEDLLRIFVAAKKAITLWGPVGSGKTRIVESMANETDEAGNNYNVITIQPSTIDPSSLHGLLTITEDPRTGSKIMNRAIPEPAKQVWDAFQNKDKLTIMFLDEMTTCTPSQQQALLGLLTHGQYGEMNISRYVTFVMAANPPGTVDAVLDLEQSVMNRGGHIPWYTETDIFLKKWGSGFGNPDKAPDRRTKEFVKLLIESDKDIAFRDDPDHYESEDEMWRIDNLVPFDRMHFSSRILTESADVFNLINRTFAESPYEIRRLYIHEAIKALAGPRWGENAGKVYDAIDSKASTESSVEVVNKYDISNSMTNEELVALIGDSLHRSKGEKMSHKQEEELARVFEEEIFYDGFREKIYRAFWVWLSTSDSEQRRQNVIPIAVRIFRRAMQVADKTSSKQSLVPRFVPVNIQREMSELDKIARRQKKAQKN